ncbi:TonB-dependent receptor [Kordiimonas sediminis]|uniref:TonB-dependent receptor n=1 Tax=Kordiimonas sediminis TaxID=1735581 RepID=A0A919AQY2_9PROT|nr:TonB-dependent receptor [Kordiimonas sediminis]GHF21006.1 TonB-dependent receptor [Kordiimonas sediminis]
MKTTFTSSLLSVSALAVFASGALSSAVTAQDSDIAILEEITVTATKRAQSIQDVPFSINAQTSNDIRRTGSQSLEDLSRNVAGLMIQNLGPGQSQVAIRGVSAGQIVRDQPGVKEQVGVYLDESVISLSLFTPDLDLYDLNRVETLRGPQGTLFGSGSVGGTIRYITNQPNLDEAEGSFEANLNQVDGGSMGYHLKGMYNLPLTDTVALRMVAYHQEYGGFIDAYTPSGDMKTNVNDGTRSGLRVAMKFEPSENVTLTPRLVYQEIDMDGFNRQEVYNLYGNEFTTDRGVVNFGEREQYLLLDEGFKDQTMIADLTAEISFGGVDLTSVTSYTDRDILVSRDASALTGSVSVDLGYPDEAVNLPSNLRDTTKVESFTQELRLSSNGNGPLQWVVGGFYSNTDRFYKQFLPTPGYDAFTDSVLGAGTAEATRAGVAPPDSPFYSELPYTLEQISLFAELTYDVSDVLHLTAGGRYYDYKEERSVTQVGLFGNGVVDQVDETSSNGFSPRVMVSYDMNEDVTLNAQVSKGFRLGGVNDPLNTALCSDDDLEVFGGFQDYNDESLWNYEAGIKMQKGAVSLNAAAFYTDIKNLQVTLDAGTCSSRISFNVPKAHTMGLEAELKARPTEGLDFALNASLIEAEFDSTIVDSLGNTLVEDGWRLPSVPKLSIGATATYSWPIEMVRDAEAFFSGTVQHRDSIFTQPSDQQDNPRTFTHGLPFGGAPADASTTLDLELDSYTTMNLSTGLMTDNWELVFYVNNVFDENANLSFNRERGGRARLAFFTNQPRTYGVTYRVNF